MALGALIFVLLKLRRCFIAKILLLFSSLCLRLALLSQRSDKRLLASSCPSVCPSVRMEQLGSRMDFCEIS